MKVAFALVVVAATLALAAGDEAQLAQNGQKLCDSRTWSVAKRRFVLMRGCSDEYYKLIHPKVLNPMDDPKKGKALADIASVLAATPKAAEQDPKDKMKFGNMNPARLDKELIEGVDGQASFLLLLSAVMLAVVCLTVHCLRCSGPCDP